MKSLVCLLLVLSLLWNLEGGCCPRNCLTCPANGQTCTTCQSGYGKDSNTNLCVPCHLGCGACTINNDGTKPCNAMSCVSPYVSDGASGCMKCQPECQTCSSNPFNCDTCPPGSTPQNVVDPTYGAIQTCVPATGCQASYCSKCVTGSTQSCAICEPGYALQGISCQECDYPAVTCSVDYANLLTNDISVFLSGVVDTVIANEYSGSYTPSKPAYPAGIDIKRKDFLSFTEPIEKILAADAKFIYDYYNTFITSEISGGSYTQDAILVAIENIIVRGKADVDNIYEIMAQEVMSLNINATADQLEEEIQEQWEKQLKTTSCGEYFYVDGANQCQSCATNCQECTMSACTQCLDGYSQDSGSPTMCTKCHADCVECEDGNPTACTECEYPKKLVGTTCIECDDPCEQCTNGQPGVCTVCQEEFNPCPRGDGTCYKCQQSACRKCREDQTCLECIQGYNLHNATCRPCQDERCSSCPGGTCQLCEERYVLNGQTCQKCPDGCLECTNDSPKVCVRCIDRFRPDETGKCTQCPEDCERCDDDGNCLEYDGVTIINNQKVKCKKNCESCGTDLSCREVKKGSFIENGKVKKCSKGCKACTDASTCTECRRGFRLKGDNTCQKCQAENCKQCDASAATCQQCYHPYDLQNNACVNECPRGCANCNTNGECIKCSEGFGPKGDGTCAKCLDTCTGECNVKDVNTCIGCIPGFVLANNKCQQCPNGCSACSADGDCTKCFPFFQPKEVSDDVIVCVEQCPFPCKECNGSMCTECYDDMTLDNGKCLAKTNCTANSSCSYCPVGSFQNAPFQCTQCMMNCVECEDGSSCETCADGFYEDNTGGCTPCPANCMICLDDSLCLKPAEGFFLDIAKSLSEIDDIDEALDDEEDFNLEPKQCSSKCKTCIFQDDICTSCANNKRKRGSKCIGRAVCKFRITFDAICQTFLASSEIDTISTQIARALSIDEDEVFFDEVGCSSTIVGGEVSAEDQASAANLVTGLGTATFTYPIVSSSYQVFQDDILIQDDEEDTASRNIGLIVGLSVGGVVLIVIIAFAAYKYKTAKQENQAIGENSEADQNYPNKVDISNDFTNQLDNVKINYS